MLWATWIACVILALARLTWATPEACQALWNSTYLNNLNTTVLFTRFYGNNTNFTEPASIPDYAAPQAGLSSFCRVVGLITTSNASATQFEIWLPESTYTNRMLTVGLGGWIGGINYPDMATGLRHGFATMSTNCGHNSSITQGAQWAFNQPEMIIDYMHRGMHVSVLSAKQVTSDYYGKPANHSYYFGCSTGGKQGLGEVELYPEDFTGVVVGSPAYDYAALQAWTIHQNLLVQPNSSSRWLPSDTIQALHASILSQCDGLDGVVDGLISDPLRCTFRPEAIQCPVGMNRTSCLNVDQVNAVRSLFTPYSVSNGTLVFSTFLPGSELQWTPNKLIQPVSPVTVDYFKYMVYNDSNWDYFGYTPKDWYFAENLNVGGGRSNSTDIHDFQSMGGKIILYVGWADPQIVCHTLYWKPSLQSAACW